MSGRRGQKCDQGYYNPGNNYEACKACGFGFTTTGSGAGRTSADCITDKGYGFTNNRMGECPIGELTVCWIGSVLSDVACACVRWQALHSDLDSLVLVCLVRWQV